MTILKGIPRNIPPQLLYKLACMGDGDTIVLGDANFPAASIGKSYPEAEVIRCDSMNMTELLEAIMTLLPLDQNTKTPATVMQVAPADVGKVKTLVWDDLKRIVAAHEHRDVDLEQLQKPDFYQRAKQAFCVVSTGEASLYGSVILKKGVLGPKVVHQINV